MNDMTPQNEAAANAMPALDGAQWAMPDTPAMPASANEAAIANVAIPEQANPEFVKRQIEALGDLIEAKSHDGAKRALIEMQQMAAEAPEAMTAEQLGEATGQHMGGQGPDAGVAAKLHAQHSHHGAAHQKPVLGEKTAKVVQEQSAPDLGPGFLKQ